MWCLSLGDLQHLLHSNISLYLNMGKLRRSCRNLSQVTQWLKQAEKEKPSCKGETKPLVLNLSSWAVFK